MAVGECHLQSVQRQVNIGAVLIAARGRNPLHHLDGALGHLAGGAFLAAPIRVSEFGDNVAPFLQSVQRKRYIKLAPKRRLHADLNIVVIDKNRYVQFLLH